MEILSQDSEPVPVAINEYVKYRTQRKIFVELQQYHFDLLSHFMKHDCQTALGNFLE